MAKKIDIGQFMIEEKDGVILLLHEVRSIGLIHEHYVDEFIAKNSLEPRTMFKLEVDAGNRFICLDKTCWDVETLENYGVDWHYVYAAENKPLLARIAGTDWYVIVSPVIKG